MTWIDRLQNRFHRFRIPHLMNYIVGGMAIVFILDFLLPVDLYGLLALNMAAVRQGQIWRLLTFIFLPPSSSLLWILFGLYFYWMIGNALEAQWGSFRFTLYYAIGILGGILAALVTGYSVNTFLNLSLFLAFAAIYPDFQVLVFFLLPVKMKYLAILDLALYVWQFIVGSWSTRLTILLSLANILLFFGGPLLRRFRDNLSIWKTRYHFRKEMRDGRN